MIFFHLNPKKLKTETMSSAESPYHNKSLVKYEPPVELSLDSDLHKVKGYKKNTTNLPPIESKPDSHTILKAILPPREWDHDGKHFVEYVSHNKASREDVSELQSNLDDRLTSRQARESGICPIREELHSQCFDEIIRQVTIECPERGLLLMRVRDELKMTIAAYQTLYKSAVAFGMRKQIQAEKGKQSMEETILNNEQRKKLLEEKVIFNLFRKLNLRIRRRLLRLGSRIEGIKLMLEELMRLNFWIIRQIL